MTDHDKNVLLKAMKRLYCEIIYGLTPSSIYKKTRGDVPELDNYVLVNYSTKFGSDTIHIRIDLDSTELVDTVYDIFDRSKSVAEAITDLFELIVPDSTK